MSAQLHEVQTIESFLKKYPVAIELTEVPENPSMENSLEQMINYFVVLKYESKAMSLYFSTGLGWVETRTGKSAPNITYRKRDKLFLKRQGSTIYDANSDRMLNRYQIRKPKVSEVLDCLA